MLRVPPRNGAVFDIAPPQYPPAAGYVKETGGIGSAFGTLDRLWPGKERLHGFAYTAGCCSSQPLDFDGDFTEAFRSCQGTIRHPRCVEVLSAILAYAFFPITWHSTLLQR